MTISWRKLRDQIRGFCDGRDAVIMVSGGVDSMFLVDFIVRAGIKPHIVHFQHGMRNNDQIDADLVKAYAEKHGLPYHCGHGEGLATCRNQEVAARDQRWAFVESVLCRLRPCPIVMTAHHLDDNIENFFMASARGRSITSLTMKNYQMINSETYPDLSYFRYKPLLDIEKEEIYNQAKRRGLEWIEDETNQGLDHERNIFRNKIIPDMMDIRNVRRSMRRLFAEIEELRSKTDAAYDG